MEPIDRSGELELGASVTKSAWSDADQTGVDVSSTLMTLGQAYGDLGTRSLFLSRVAPDDSEVGKLELSEGSKRYEYLRLLGRGGMGQVDQVWDQDLMRKLAVKRLHPERAESPLALRQFLWEARVTAHLDHPNIVPVHDLGKDHKGELFFTMKFVHGTSLAELLASLARVEAALAAGEVPTPVDEIVSAEHMTALRRVRLFIDLCQAIDFAHERGVLHRDLKPANIMIGQYGEVLIMDWGLAFPLPGPAGEGLRELLPELLQDREQDSSRPSGTPRYMSPEQVNGEDLDERSDIYSLGVILYELLTLRSPYAATDVTRLLLQVSDGEIEPLTKTGPSVPDELAHVVNRALATDAKNRYASVRELTDDIEAVLDGFAPALGPDVSMMAPIMRATADEAEAEDRGASESGAAVRDPAGLEAARSGAPIPVAVFGLGLGLGAVLASQWAALGTAAGTGILVGVFALALGLWWWAQTRP